jgi:hypothetical protein
MVRRLAALAASLALVLTACSGGASGPTGPDGPPNPDPAPAPQPPPPPPPPPQGNAGITGTYRLIQINGSTPGQMVSVANPDGILIGLYRFDASTQLVLDPLQTFALDIHYRDDKGEYRLQDEGEFKNATPPSDEGMGLTFSSAIYGDKFTGAASDGMIGISYDFDGDGRLDTVFLFQRVGG